VSHPEGVRLVTCGADAQLAERDEISGALITERRVTDCNASSAILAIASPQGGARVATADKAGCAKVGLNTHRCLRHRSCLGSKNVQICI
jgi:hypothetical protein